MTSRAEELLHAVLALPVGDRADVAAELLASLVEPAERDRHVVDEAWACEVECRAGLVLAGESVGELWSDVRARLTLKT